MVKSDNAETWKLSIVCFLTWKHIFLKNLEILKFSILIVEDRRFEKLESCERENSTSERAALTCTTCSAISV